MDAVTDIYDALSHCWFLLMIKPGVPKVLFHPGPNGTPGLSSVDLSTLSGGAVYASCFQTKVDLEGPKPKETGDLKQEAYSFDITFV
jgi:hypothetical protein